MIRNIIFDFGGVIYDIDHNLSKIAFEKLGVENFDQLYGHQIQTQIFEKLEVGAIDESGFIHHLKQYLNPHVREEDIVNAWCALLIGFDKQTVELLKKLGEHYKIFLLSNSNIIHYKRFIKELNEYTNFRALFTDVWYSHEKGMRKPDPEFYLQLLKANNLKAKETLFIDDLDVNIEAAKKLGIQTHYLHQQHILELFENGILKARD